MIRLLSRIPAGTCPEELDYQIVSDISGKDITNASSLWRSPDDEVCSEEEAIEQFLLHYATPLVTKEEAAKAVAYFKQFGLALTTEEAFQETVKIKRFRGREVYAFKDNLESDDLENAGFTEITDEDLEEILKEQL